MRHTTRVETCLGHGRGKRSTFRRLVVEGHREWINHVPNIARSGSSATIVHPWPKTSSGGPGGPPLFTTQAKGSAQSAASAIWRRAMILPA